MMVVALYCSVASPVETTFTPCEVKYSAVRAARPGVPAPLSTATFAFSERINSSESASAIAGLVPELVNISSRKMRICSGRGLSTSSPLGDLPKVTCSVPIVPRLMSSSGIRCANHANWTACSKVRLVCTPAEICSKIAGARLTKVGSISALKTRLRMAMMTCIVRSARSKSPPSVLRARA